MLLVNTGGDLNIKQQKLGKSLFVEKYTVIHFDYLKNLSYFMFTKEHNLWRSSHDCTLTLCTETKWSYPDNTRNRKCVVFDTFTWREKKEKTLEILVLSVSGY